MDEILRRSNVPEQHLLNEQSVWESNPRREWPWLKIPSVPLWSGWEPQICVICILNETRVSIFCTWSSFFTPCSEFLERLTPALNSVYIQTHNFRDGTNCCRKKCPITTLEHGMRLVGVYCLEYRVSVWKWFAWTQSLYETRCMAKKRPNRSKKKQKNSSKESYILNPEKHGKKNISAGSGRARIFHATDQTSLRILKVVKASGAIQAIQSEFAPKSKAQ